MYFFLDQSPVTINYHFSWLENNWPVGIVGSTYMQDKSNKWILW